MTGEVDLCAVGPLREDQWQRVTSDLEWTA